MLADHAQARAFNGRTESTVVHMDQVSELRPDRVRQLETCSRPILQDMEEAEAYCSPGMKLPKSRLIAAMGLRLCGSIARPDSYARTPSFQL